MMTLPAPTPIKPMGEGAQYGAWHPVTEARGEAMKSALRATEQQVVTNEAMVTRDRAFTRSP